MGIPGDDASALGLFGSNERASEQQFVNNQLLVRKQMSAVGGEKPGRKLMVGVMG
jgi:hypothetical protein